MLICLFRRARDEESGMAMVIAIVLSTVIVTLAVMSMAIGTHTDKATARGRHWVQALHVAESGVEQAIAKIEQAKGAFSGPFVGSTDSGDFVVNVTRSARNNYSIEATGSVREGRQLSATRKLRVTLAPPAVFKNALFSYTSVVTKNNDVIKGDIWANQNVVIAQGTIVEGAVNAATGYVAMSNGSRIDKDVVSGGFNSTTSRAVSVGMNARIKGSVRATVVNPPDPITCGGADPTKYAVHLDGGATIDGTVRTWGTVTGSGTVGGGSTPNVCMTAPATEPMPTFTYAPENYDAATLVQFGTPGAASATAVADFHNYLNNAGKAIRGTFYINQSGALSQTSRINLTGVTLTGDTTIITNTGVFSNGVTDSSSGSIFVLISTYQPPTGTSCTVDNDQSECSIHLKNNFEPGCKTATLVYAPFGPTAVKNNSDMCGAIYSTSIDIMNNQTLTYDARIERAVGFGPVTLEITRWLEVTA